MRFFQLLYLPLMAGLIVSCNDSGSNTATKEDSASGMPAALKEENISYTADNLNMNGYVAFRDTAGKKPAVLVVHEWWGLNDYAKDRAKQLAELGYVAMAVDMFGDGKNGEDPTEAGKLAGPFYNDPSLARQRLDAAIAKIKTYEQVDTSRIAAIGYCFGGYVVLNAAKLGSDLDGVVSFHGGLAGAAPLKDQLKAKILVLHGEADNLVPEAEQALFKKQMDSVGADYRFKTYPNAMHAFTNPQATETGRKFGIPVEYNAIADTASWNDMKVFLQSVLR